MVSRKALGSRSGITDVHADVMVEEDRHQPQGGDDAKLDKLPKILASSKKGTRQRGMQALATWLATRDASEEDLKKVWKGLFYAVWHADKAPVQEELIERVAGLMLSLEAEAARRFLQVFLWTMRREWSGIDRLRLDKFYLLLRTFLRTALEYMHRAHWEARLVTALVDVYAQGTLEAKDKHSALGISLHLTDIFLEEASRFAVPPVAAPLLLEPFLRILSHSADKLLLPRVETEVFGALIDERQRSGGDAEGSPLSTALDFSQLASRLFALASAPETAPKNRAALYAVHARLKKQGGDALFQNGGQTEHAEEPPTKENGKRPAPVLEKEKGKKKRKAEIVKFDEIEAGSLEAGDAEGRGVVLAEKEKRGTRGAKALVESGLVEESALVAEVNEKKAKKGRKKGQKEPVSGEENGHGLDRSEGEDMGTSEKGNLEGGQAQEGGVQPKKRTTESGPGGLIAGKTTRKGKRKTDRAVEKPDVTEASVLDGELPGKKKARNTRQASQVGGVGEVEVEPPVVAPQNGKKSRAALERAAAKGGGSVSDALTVDPIHAGNGSADVPSEKRKRRKAAQLTADAEMAADVSAVADPAENKKRRKVAKGAVAGADVAADVSGVAVGREASTDGVRKEKRGKAKGAAGSAKVDAIAAIESALEELRRAAGDASGGAAEDAPAVTPAQDAPAVDTETGRKKRRKKKLAQGGEEAETPGTPVGEVDFQSSAVENESAAKRRKSGAGATPPVASKLAAASDGRRGGHIGKSRFAPASPGESPGAVLASRFAEADDTPGPRSNFKKTRGSSASDEQPILFPRTPEAGSTPAAVTPGPLSNGASARGSAPGSSGGAARGSGGSHRKKKVRFSLKNNLEFKVGSPLPEKTMRTPPAATPRGSALKVTGPSPIRKMGTSLVDGYVIGSRRNKKERRSPALIHVAGMRGRGGGGRGRGAGSWRGSGKADRRVRLVR
ncbi:Nop52 containing protein [Klebsormidium nitens]|uniref:Nop52 containing protein n=1 Tax=Klebsormidium nitens TaxID=105231 RepID=A0A1Y1HMC9_KLENI|nr:Nop52 containing protein [Klebsormidium nitens]|eukprot:GAQ77707.1 Nop52 containing protein [Klebsormidium nitens]